MPGIRRQFKAVSNKRRPPKSGRPLPRPKPGNMRPGPLGGFKRPRLERQEIRQAANQIKGKVKNVGPIRTALSRVKKERIVSAPANLKRQPVTGGTTPQRQANPNIPERGQVKRQQANPNIPERGQVKRPASAGQNKLPSGIVQKVESLNKKRKPY